MSARAQVTEVTEVYVEYIKSLTYWPCRGKVSLYGSTVNKWGTQQVVACTKGALTQRGSYTSMDAKAGSSRGTLRNEQLGASSKASVTPFTRGTGSTRRRHAAKVRC